MTPLQNLTVEQLRIVISMKEQIETLRGEIEAVTGGDAAAPQKRRGSKKMSFAARARLGAAARWAEVRAANVKGFLVPDAEMKLTDYCCPGFALDGARLLAYYQANSGGGF